ncbi:hypothetical protein PGH07_07240 [Sulfurovum sp. zt1-1]|uniref:Uncharacterized protein n=1 Tax=Sulfurovum zhangzhouensis TaxID=3019067 RepID=A0ABT7QYQ6_9BACT|nr:hypothetical protein [Sulfurovum zhangzhouensis]MDM5271968.1 hypothetical protein [Sulfurovum zhangzhouensis]
MMLEKFYTDDAYILDEHGNKSGPYKTRFGSGKTLTFLDEMLEIVVDTGYQIIRPLDDGSEMVFNVIAYDFQEKINRIPPQHILKIENAYEPHVETEPVRKNVDDFNVFQAEDNKVINIPDSLIELIERINASDCTLEEKEEAKSVIKKLLENPTVSAILKDAASGLLLLLD